MSPDQGRGDAVVTKRSLQTGHVMTLTAFFDTWTTW